MHFLLHAIQRLDIGIYSFLNRFAGNYVLDRLISHVEANCLFKGGVLVAAYWYFWFRPGVHQQKNRRAIIAIMVGTVLAIVAVRSIAAAAPFRVRPIYEPSLIHHLSVHVSDFESWNGFPSDTAAYICALAFGLTYLSRRLTVPVILYTAGWICLPRLYLGIHYASDVLAGAAIAIAAVWLVLRIEGLQSNLATRVLAVIEAKPHLSAAAAFLVSYEMVSIFWDVRTLGHGMMHAIRVGPNHHMVWIAAMSAVALGLAALGCILLAYRDRNPSSARGGLFEAGRSTVPLVAQAGLPNRRTTGL